MAGPILSFRDLDAWNAATDLVPLVYALCRRLPRTEQFGLVSQMQRASVSVPSNIAEGHANGPGARYRWHVRTALGSLAELDTHFEIIQRLDYLNVADVKTAERQLARTRQLLHGLNRSLLRSQTAKALLVGATFLCGFTLVL